MEECRRNLVCSWPCKFLSKLPVGVVQVLVSSVHIPFTISPWRKRSREVLVARSVGQEMVRPGMFLSALWTGLVYGWGAYASLRSLADAPSTSCRNCSAPGKALSAAPPSPASPRADSDLRYNNTARPPLLEGGSFQMTGAFHRCSC